MAYAIPAVLAFVFAVLLWLIKRDRLSLEYEINESTPFPQEQQMGRAFFVNLYNTGNRKLERIDFKVAFDSPAIHVFRFADPKLVGDVQDDRSSITTIIPLLNPKEAVSLTITTVGLPEGKSPAVTARAPGATAKPKQLLSKSEYLSALIGIFVGVLIVVLVVVILPPRLFGSNVTASAKTLNDASSKLEKTATDATTKLDELNAKWRREIAERKAEAEKEQREYEEAQSRFEKGEPETAQVVFGVLTRAQLADRFFELANTGDITYWRTVLFLAHGFVKDQKNRDRYVDAVRGLLDDGAKMAPSSRGFALYLLAKMEKYRGNSKEAMKRIEQCRKSTPLMYEHLMAQDSEFRLESLGRGQPK